jgi:hypothetical protein
MTSNGPRQATDGLKNFYQFLPTWKLPMVKTQSNAKFYTATRRFGEFISCATAYLRRK